MTSPDAVTRHLGIRFAVADRFQPPRVVPFEPGAAPADLPGPICPQVPGMIDTLLGIDTSSMGEDCLHLNVFTPADVDDRAGLPVLVYIHGGSYLNGSGSIPWYDGGSLARRGHVVVTINYRLGCFGYLGEHNWGTLDQIAALQWVQHHIAGFGGDPANVTIFGESAGGSAVVSLVASPDAQHLFHRAWAMSPSIRQLRSIESAQRWLDAFLGHAGVADIEAARALSVEELLAAQAATVEMPNLNYDMFAPTAGGAALPVDLLDQAAANPKPFCVGTNRDENLQFLAFDPAYAEATEAQWLDHVTRTFGERADEARARYEAARPGATPLTLLAAVQTDHEFRRPAQILCEARAAHGHPSWMYWFTWASPAFDGILGSSHAMDIPFAFDNLHMPGSELVLGDGPERQGIATRFADEIAHFAAKGSASWEPFDPEGRATLRIDAATELLHDPEPELRLLQPE